MQSSATFATPQKLQIKLQYCSRQICLLKKFNISTNPMSNLPTYDVSDPCMLVKRLKYITSFGCRRNFCYCVQQKCKTRQPVAEEAEISRNPFVQFGEQTFAKHSFLWHSYVSIFSPFYLHVGATDADMQLPTGLTTLLPT